MWGRATGHEHPVIEQVDVNAGEGTLPALWGFVVHEGSAAVDILLSGLWSPNAARRLCWDPLTVSQEGRQSAGLLVCSFFILVFCVSNAAVAPPSVAAPCKGFS